MNFFFPTLLHIINENEKTQKRIPLIETLKIYNL